MAEKLGYEEWGDRRVLKIHCACGRTLLCPGFTNTCDCGRDYNWAGQQLASRSQWGEETNEHPTDILNVDSLTPKECFEEEP